MKDEKQNLRQYKEPDGEPQQAVQAC